MDALHRHQRVRLRLDIRNTFDLLELGQNFRFRGETRGFPFTEIFRAQPSVDLEVQASAAHRALDLSFRLECGQVFVQNLLHRRERGLIVIGAPFASELARDVRKIHALRDRDFRRHGATRSSRRLARSRDRAGVQRVRYFTR